jgi:hypothetical protein
MVQVAVLLVMLPVELVPAVQLTVASLETDPPATPVLLQFNCAEPPTAIGPVFCGATRQSASVTVH